MSKLELLEKALELALSIAERSAKHSDPLSVPGAYDRGRHDGLRQALELLADVKEGRLT